MPCAFPKILSPSLTPYCPLPPFALCLCLCACNLGFALALCTLEKKKAKKKKGFWKGAAEIVWYSTCMLALPKARCLCIMDLTLLPAGEGGAATKENCCAAAILLPPAAAAIMLLPLPYRIPIPQPYYPICIPATHLGRRKEGRKSLALGLPMPLWNYAILHCVTYWSGGLTWGDSYLYVPPYALFSTYTWREWSGWMVCHAAYLTGFI